MKGKASNSSDRLCYSLQSLLILCVLGFIALVVFSILSPQSTTVIATSSTKLQKATMNTHVEILHNGQAQKYKLRSNGKFLTFQEVIQGLAQGDIALMNQLHTIVTSFPSEAVFWECRPVRSSTWHNAVFEFVLLPAPTLAQRSVDPSNFMNQFEQYKCSTNPDVNVITFFNLGRDAMLVVPCPPPAGTPSSALSMVLPSSSSSATAPPQYMTHLQSFIRGASKEHTYSLFQRIGEAFQQVLQESAAEDKPLWLSTSGLGVSWLHVRIDMIPKYYNWQEYKTSTG